MGKSDQEIPLRIIVVEPPAGVSFALQRGKAELTSVVISTGADLSFELTARVSNKEDVEPNLLGPFVQGPRGGRFVYVNSGTLAGQTGSSWTRRAKIGLQGITWKLISQASAKPTSILEVRIKGTAKDGGPACASVPLLDGGWKVVAR
jgi:uncharacterized protein DUF5990